MFTSQQRCTRKQCPPLLLLRCNHAFRVSDRPRCPRQSPELFWRGACLPLVLLYERNKGSHERHSARVVASSYTSSWTQAHSMATMAFRRQHSQRTHNDSPQHVHSSASAVGASNSSSRESHRQNEQEK